MTGAHNRLSDAFHRLDDELSSGVPLPSFCCSIGTSSPVSPSATTSGMPPVAVATTGTSQAIASRLTMPIGS